MSTATACRGAKDNGNWDEEGVEEGQGTGGVSLLSEHAVSHAEIIGAQEIQL